MLNSLFGKFGQKDIENRIKIVSREEAIKLVKVSIYHTLLKLMQKRF